MPKTGRNDPCPCGSGKKYKRCCMPRDRERTAEVFRNVIATEPRNPEGCNALGLIALEAGQHEAAIELLGRAVKGNRREPAYHCNLGLAYRAAGKLDDAIRSLSAALALRADFFAARLNLGVIYSELGRYGEAKAQFGEAMKADPASAQAHNNLGMVLLQQGDAERALQFFQAALDLNPSDALAEMNAGNALQRLGRLPEAIERFERALTIKPDLAVLHCNLAKALSDFGKVEEAAKSYRAALALEPDFAEAHNGLGVMMMELGRKEEAIVSVRTALSLNPDLGEAHFNLHSLLIDWRNLWPSIECLRRCVALRPGDLEAGVQLAALLEYAGDPEAATHLIRGLGELSPAAAALLDASRYIKGYIRTTPLGPEVPRLVGVGSDALRIAFQHAMTDGLVLEFGVRFGVSIRQIAQLSGQQVHGFDSFEGLPEAWHVEPRGTYSTHGAVPEVPANVALHKGWFEDTLPPFLGAHPGAVRFVNVDCDLYSSTRTVLELLADRITCGTVIVFDEYLGNERWREDEFRAFQESVARHGWSYEYVCFSLCSRQAVVRITQAP